MVLVTMHINILRYNMKILISIFLMKLDKDFFNNLSYGSEVWIELFDKYLW